MHTAAPHPPSSAPGASDGVEWYVRKFRLETQESESIELAEPLSTKSSSTRNLLLGFVSSLLGLSALLLVATYSLIK
jgi:hypothetical protein